MKRKKSAFQLNTTTILIGLICILAVVLMVVICVAIAGGGSGTPSQTIPAGSTGNPSQSTTTGTPTSSVSTQTKELAFSYPTKTDVAVVEPEFHFRGTSDPNVPLTVNGAPVVRSADGSFDHVVILLNGENLFTFTYNGQTVDYRVECRYVVQSYSPMGDQSYNSGALVCFQVFARKGSTVTALFNGTTVTLKENLIQEGTGIAPGFANFTGEYRLPDTNTSDLDMGVVTYTASCNGNTETYTSGKITCLKTNQILASDPSATPSGGKYINVGSGYIAEIIGYTAETFDGKTTDDYSHPTNNYLPKGTVDYCPTNIIQVGNLKYVQLRSGQRVYLDKKDIYNGTRLPVTDRHIGRLPDHNEINVASMTDTGKHLVLALDVMWKAPFYFDLAPQQYYYPNGGADRNYSVTACTATHIDLTFCYATKFTGTVQLPENNPVFSHAEVINNGSDHTLRLHLKKVGAFYGWEAYYNENNQLCFKFLKPAVVSVADNAYGVDLTGIKVMIDVGHGGRDGGAVGTDANGRQVEEADRNLAMALLLKQELESIGAEVVMNRYDDSLVYVDERLRLVKQEAPDICVCIHHNSAGNYTSANGLEVYYYDAFSQAAANAIYQASKGSSVYQKVSLNWHNYYVSRQTICPVILTENGYMSNAFDVSQMIDAASLQIKIQGIASGVANYFLNLNK